MRRLDLRDLDPAPHEWDTAYGHAVPRAEVDVDQALAAIRPICEDVRERGVDAVLERRTYKRTKKVNGKRGVKHVRKQFPLCLAFARTYHSAQGSTISTPVDMDLISVGFKKHGVWKQVPGLVYVALSRVRSLAQIRFHIVAA